VSLSPVGILVAAIDLQVVQSVIAAIRNADRESLARLPTVANPNSDTYCRQTITPEPRYLPRPILHPTPRYLPRPVIHPRPVVEQPSVLPPPPQARVPHITAGPQPPWKILPWQEPAIPPDVIKVTVRPSDIVTKGNLIDLFV
jgi:hypothetical protein